MCVCVCWVLCCNLHMAQLMSDGEGGTDSIFLADGAAPVWVAHGPQLCKACRATWTHGNVNAYRIKKNPAAA